MDGSDKIFATGAFREDVDFVPSYAPCNEDEDIHSASGSRDVFLVKHQPDGCWLLTEEFIS